MVALGTMLCLSMICGCLVSRNHYLFRLKSSFSNSSPNLTSCPSHSNFLAARCSSDTSKPSTGVTPTQLPSPVGNELSISAAFLHQEPEQNYIQFYNPPPPSSTQQYHHDLPPSCIHDAYQSLPRHRHVQYSTGALPSPQIDNRRGMVYANGEVGGGKATLLVPVTSNHPIHHPYQLRGGTEWVLDAPELHNLENPTNLPAATSTFIVNAAPTAEPNNRSAAAEISTLPRYAIMTLMQYVVSH